VLDDSLVSRQHARIQKIKDAYFITDLSSSNGTYVNGTRVPEGKYVKLSKQDIITLGRTELRVF
jgi:pSer/pThr/pTyr-binding forkhead associated (FHA) protein